MLAAFSLRHAVNVYEKVCTDTVIPLDKTSDVYSPRAVRSAARGPYACMSMF
jgi:hypothetical protein